MAKKNITLSVALAVYNEASNIERCLTSVRDVASEIVVVDGGSNDNTVDLARKLGAHVYVTDNPPIFHINKQKALDRTKGQWILQLDADEVVDKDLKEEILRTIANPQAHDGYFIPRRNYFLGKWLRKGGLYPDYVIRLFKQGKGRFPQRSVHEQISVFGSVGHLTHPLDHYSYLTIAQYWRKAHSYIRLTAEELKHFPNNRSLGMLLAYNVTKPMWTFVQLFIRHKGFMDGWRGFLFAVFSAMHIPKAYWEFRRSV